MFDDNIDKRTTLLWPELYAADGKEPVQIEIDEAGADILRNNAAGDTVLQFSVASHTRLFGLSYTTVWWPELTVLVGLQS